MMGIKSEKLLRARGTSTSLWFIALLAAVMMLLNIADTRAEAGKPGSPSAAQIEEFLRAAQGEQHPHIPPAYQVAVMTGFDLLKLEEVTGATWVAIAELSFDFGPPPPAVIGFDQRRNVLFRIVLDRKDGALKLKRFAAMGGVRPLLVRE